MAGVSGLDVNRAVATERVQAAARVVIAGTVTVLVAALAALPVAIEAAIALYFVVALGLLGATRRAVAESPWRRGIALAADCGVLAAVMAEQGSPGAALYLVLLWLATDHGLRHAGRWLVIAPAVAATAFAAVIATTPFWRENAMLAAGLWLGLLGLPVYLGHFMRRTAEASTLAAGATAADASMPRPRKTDRPAATDAGHGDRALAHDHAAASDALLRERDPRASASPDPGEVDVAQANEASLPADPTDDARTPPRPRPVLFLVGKDPPRPRAAVVPIDDPFVRHRARTRPMRALLVAEAGATQTLIARILARAGHRVVLETSFQNALSRLAATDLDLMIAALPEREAQCPLEWLGEARVLGCGGRRTPLVLIDDGARDDLVAAGADVVLPRPVDATRLLEVLARVASGAPAAAPVGNDALDLGVLGELDELGLGREFVRVFAIQCLNDAGACLERARSAAMAGQWGLLHEECQALKGVASNMGAKRVAELASQVMALPSWRLSREWPEWAPRLEHEVRRIGTGLDAALASLGRRAEAACESGESGGTPDH